MINRDTGDMPPPIYTLENTRFACPLQWTLAVFWREVPKDDAWRPKLAAALDPDGIRLLQHRFATPTTSLFLLSSLPHVAPVTLVQRVKGRLQYLVRDHGPKPLRGNYAIHSIGRATREAVEGYVQSQVSHHPMADQRVVDSLDRCQIVNENVDLTVAQRTSQGMFWHNLHVVLVHRDRWMEIREHVLQEVRGMILRASRAKGYRLSRAGILPDHVHLAIGCPIDVAPVDVALGFLNNLAYVHGMRPVFQYGGFIGTFGEYDFGAIKPEDVDG